MKNNRFVKLVMNTLRIFSSNEMSVYSGYATLYILMAMIPLLMLVIAVINLLPGFSAEDFSTWLSQFIKDLPAVQSMLDNVIRNLNSQSGGLVASVSALTTLWSASNGVSAIQTGLEQIAGQRKSGLKGKPKALAVTLLFILLIPALLLTQLLKQPLIDLVDTLAASLPAAALPAILKRILESSGPVALAAMVFLIVVCYAWLPAEKTDFRSQLPGAVFTSVSAAAFTLAFGFFMGNFWKASSVYGSLAAVFLTAMWMKFIITILFYGASLNRALKEKS